MVRMILRIHQTNQKINDLIEVVSSVDEEENDIIDMTKNLVFNSDDDLQSNDGDDHHSSFGDKNNRGFIRGAVNNVSSFDDDSIEHYPLNASIPSSSHSSLKTTNDIVSGGDKIEKRSKHKHRQWW
jgi:hypothetical protein